MTEVSERLSHSIHGVGSRDYNRYYKQQVTVLTQQAGHLPLRLQAKETSSPRPLETPSQSRHCPCKLPAENDHLTVYALPNPAGLMGMVTDAKGLTAL